MFPVGLGFILLGLCGVLFSLRKADQYRDKLDEPNYK